MIGSGKRPVGELAGEGGAAVVEAERLAFLAPSVARTDLGATRVLGAEANGDASEL
jgi:hypothetical protein